MGEADDRRRARESEHETLDLEFRKGEPVRLISIFGGYRHEQIDDRRQMTELGNPAIILLLAYLLTLPGIILTFFAFKPLWYYGFNVYSIYVFLLSAGCIAAGLYLLFRRIASSPRSSHYVRDFRLFASAGCVASGSIFLLILFGPIYPEAAILLSVIFVAAMIACIASARNIEREDMVPFAFYGIGATIVALVPVHQAFGLWGGGGGSFEFTILDGMLIVVGVTVSLISLNSIRNRSGYLAAWLIGAMLIALVSYHELTGITASGSFEIYDQALALEGAVYSLIPLSLYLIGEYRSAKLWTHVVNTKRALDSNDYDRALRNGERAIEILSSYGFSNKVSLPWSLYGDVFYKLGKFNRAKTLYDIALQIDPYDYETWSNLGNMYLVKGYNEHALMAFTRAAELKPDDARILNNLGVANLASKRYDEALRAFQKATELDPEFTIARYNAGILLLRLGRPGAAMKHFEILMRLAPNDESYRKAYERTSQLLVYFQQAAGWKMLGADVSGLVNAIVEKHSKFNDHYSKFLKGIASDLSKKATNWDRSESAKLALRLLREIGSEGTRIDDLKAKSGIPQDQLMYSVAILALTHRVRFDTVNNELRLLPVTPANPEEGSVSGAKLKSHHLVSRNNSA